MRGQIELRNVSKAYGANLALKGVSRRFAPGKVHALLGKNGSGKSTLIEILAGAVQPTLGELWVNGARVHFDAPGDALAEGVVTVHQDLSLVPSISVAENIFLGRLPKTKRLGVPVVDWRALNRRAAAFIEEIGIAIDPRTLVGSLTVGQQQSIEIAKAVAKDPAILLLDEPTSALASREVEQLFGLIRRLKQRGVTMIYISHRTNEIFAICDTCTVLHSVHRGRPSKSRYILICVMSRSISPRMRFEHDLHHSDGSPDREGFHHHGRGGGHHRHGRGGSRGRPFDYGDLRLLLLAMIAQRPRHGYELIKAIEDRMGGSYSPSPGVIYPTLAWLDDMGYAAITIEAGNRKLYRITPEGEAFLLANRATADELLSRAGPGGPGEPDPVPAPVVRAMENLKLAVRLRLRRGPLDPAAAEAVAAALDAAAQAVERS